MIRVRLFSPQQPVGFVRFDEAGHRVRPDGLLDDELVALIRKDLQRGQMSGLVGLYHWYRQATPFCPLDAAKPCPCDDSVCGVDGTPREAPPSRGRDG